MFWDAQEILQGHFRFITVWTSPNGWYLEQHRSEQSPTCCNVWWMHHCMTGQHFLDNISIKSQTLRNFIISVFPWSDLELFTAENLCHHLNMSLLCWNTVLLFPRLQFSQRRSSQKAWVRNIETIYLGNCVNFADQELKTWLPRPHKFLAKRQNLWKHVF